jgi:hypothetical protein
MVIRMSEDQKELAKVIEKYFGADAGYLDISCFDLAKRIIEAGWIKPMRCKDCKYGFVDDEDFPNQYLCKHNGCDWNDGDHFCRYGERRDTE